MSDDARRLLIVYHSKGGSTEQLVRRIYAGATHADIHVNVRLTLARDAGLDDLLWCDAMVLASPENFGYMCGAVKDFFERTYYPAGNKLEGLPVSLVICAGNNGTGALNSIRGIIKGYPFKEVQEPLICVGGVTEEILEQCEELGMGMAAGVEAGIF